MLSLNVIPDLSDYIIWVQIRSQRNLLIAADVFGDFALVWVVPIARLLPSYLDII